MLDLRDLAEGQELRADLCIVGAGPAGLAVAAELRGAGREVLLLESGGPEPVPGAQGLGVGTVSGDTRYGATPLTGTRHRQVGGTAHLWDISLDGADHGVRLIPFGDEDLRGAPSWRAAWPLDAGDLAPFYARAHELLGLGPVRYDAAPWTAPDAAPLALRDVDTDVFRFAPGERLSRDLRDRVTADPSCRIATHATATELVVEHARVDHVVVASAPGRRHRVRCREVVLAAGGIENARLLLASARGRGGLGNDHDLVGRTFMDHPLVRAGMLRSRPGIRAALGFYDHRTVDGSRVMGRLVVGRGRLGGELPGSAFYLLPRPAGYDPELASQLRRAVLARDAGSVVAALRHPRAVAGVARGVVARRRDAWPEMSRGGWSRQSGPARRWPDLELVQRCEQVPDRTNRVVLSERRDALGAPVADVHWTWTDDDRAGAAAAQVLLAQAFASAGLGRTDLVREPDGSAQLLGGTHHHMGATRMSADPAAGVVDPDGRLHGVANVYVTGSSVFPTSGTPNPTLTILALAARLAAHLRAQP
ncbi:MAG: FAD-binding protein [Actinobacteria bacterium]|nr:FAD-binding protein [Actinomycetota bacterium]